MVDMRGSELHDITYVCHLRRGLCLAVVVEHLLPVAKVNTYLQTAITTRT